MKYGTLIKDKNGNLYRFEGHSSYKGIDCARPVKGGFAILLTFKYEVVK